MDIKYNSLEDLCNIDVSSISTSAYYDWETYCRYMRIQENIKDIEESN